MAVGDVMFLWLRRESEKMIDEGMWNRLLEQREELLAEVKRLRKRLKQIENIAKGA